MTRPRFPRHAYTLALALPLLLGACTDAAESVPPATSAPAVASAVSSAQAAFLDSRIAELEARHSTRIGVTAVDPTTGAVYRHRGAERFALCSTFKTYAAAEVLRRTSEGTSSLDKAVPVEASALVENSPVTAAAVGTSMTLAELAEAALTRSDNTAGNLLLTEIGGPQAITALARSIGDDTTRLDRWETELNTALRGDPRDTSTTDGLAEGYRALLLGDELEPTHRRQLLDWLRASTTSDTRIRAGLPPGWSAADKTGTGRFGTANDAGVVWDREGNPLVLVILTDSSTNQEAAQPNSDAIAETTTAVIGALDAP
ncbi:class A beta-lactamase [Rhodococcus oxybenzonivorans]|uniref:class A beta-lactamase n=1 Tax=Rhodococcus oxybenzonivorans TaxID=1990687 RepID=UPI0029532646|nr:class A beta-lactamase [Rhodococcus oxybenzonivorans]MDV7351497.1 class A beta-lactamase [Rhodococcus oxybenzonivorans]